MLVAMIMGGISGSGPADAAAVGAMIVALLLVGFVPEIVLWLPRTLGYL